MLVLLLAVASAELPDSGAGLLALGGMVAWWLVAVQQPAVWWGAAGRRLRADVPRGTRARRCGSPGLHAHLGRGRSAGPALRSGAAGHGRLALVVEVAEEGGEPPALIVGVTLALVAALPWYASRRSA